ncbi:uncharacterized protein LOC118193317 [Stegodyphus dumicola]|uniref:uncharacterized protein LOC118193317 n=1 Tax=Stegodyphus dumicola TaxID=202533 RepID=UPI0015B004FE|nr:uncharacterized protein LOC118193317 [Stegodyphus dumicola]
MNVPNTIYPLSKACSFLAVNYYEEISSVFEDYLSEVLIPENSSLLNEESSLLLNTDDFYRYPWQKVPYDEEFIVKLVQEARESISEICKNTVLSEGEFKLDFDEDINLKSEDLAEEETVWEEKSLNNFNLDTLLEEFQLLEELPISNSLLKSSPRNPSVLILREELPFIEYEDMFKEEYAISFETTAAFTDWNPFEVLENSATDDCALDVEELSLPDLSLNETVCLEQQTEHEVNLETNYSSKESNSEAISSDDHASFYLLYERKRNANLKENMLFDNSRSAKIDPSALKVHKLAEKNFFLCPDIEHDMQSFDMCDEKSLWNNDEQLPLHQDIFLENCLSEKEKFLNEQENADNIATLFNVLEESGCHENNRRTFSDSVPRSDTGNKIGNMKELCIEQETDNNVKCYKDMSPNKTSLCSNNFNEEEALSEDTDIDKFFNSILQNSAKTLSPYDKITDFDQYTDLHHPRISNNICARPSLILEESTGSKNFEDIKREDTQEITNLNKKLFLEKLSGLSWDKKIEPMKPKNDHDNIENINESKMSIAYKDKKPLNFQNTRKQSLSEMASFSQNSCSLKLSNSMDMLSAFLLSKKSRKSQKSDNADASSGSSDFGISVTFPQDATNCVLSKDLTYLQPNSSNEALCAMPEIYVQDLHVTLPDEYMKIVLLYETSAVPFIQKLLLSNKFPVSLNFMLTDIPSYTTCFLLNQEVKQCQDKIINPVSEGRGDNFYIPLLCLHGILKSMEYFIQFDPELAVTCLGDFEKSHISLLKCW